MDDCKMTKFKVPLYKNQADALDKLSNGRVLVGDVGAGKSRTSLAYYIYKELKIGVKTSDNCLTYDFKDLSWYGKEKKHLYIITTAMKRDKLEWEDEGLPFGLTFNQDSPVDMHVDSWQNIKKYVDVKESYFIFDEQKLSTTGVWSKAFLQITKHNRWILLSATPGDCYSDYLTLFLAWGWFKNKTEFNREHCVYSRFSKYPKIERYINTVQLEKYRRFLLVIMPDQRTTERIHKNVFCDFDKAAYDIIFKKRWNPYDEEPIEDAGKMCLLLRKLVNLDDSRFQNLWYVFLRHKRVIVFYSFNAELEKLREFLNDKNVPFSEWNGQAHEAIPDTDSWVYLVNYMAGAEGWNCITTNCVVFFSQQYSYKIATQAAGRTDRINTPYHEQYYYHFTSNSSIDKAISLALKKKKNFNEKSFVKF